MGSIARTGVAASLDAPLVAPITVRSHGDSLRLFAAGIPVTPVNLALRARTSHGATAASVRSYAYACRLYLSFLASRGLALLDATNDDFSVFTAALLGNPYSDARGDRVHLPGARAAQTAHSVVGRLYGLFGDIERDYRVEFDWRRYKPISTTRGWSGPWTDAGSTRHPARFHTFRVPTREPLGFPDEQLARALMRARDLWGDEIADGDRAFAPSPDSQRGALFWRNVAVVFSLRFAGARRAEVGPIDFADVRREHGTIALVTKGRQGAKESVVLVPVLAAAISKYAFDYRPHGSTRHGPVDRDAVFVSHGVNSYGERISAETVRSVIEALRPAVDEPWRSALTPHLLRHAFAYAIQAVAGPVALSANMRHRSIHSADAYRAAAGQWREQLQAASASTATIFRAHGLSFE